MKKMTTAATLVAMLGLLWGAAAWAQRGPQGVYYGPHNMSRDCDGCEPGIRGAWPSDNETQVCIFCHTPHGGSLDGPLWNRPNPSASGYSHYNSASLSTAVKSLGADRPVEKESLLCLSCHDGSIGVNTLINNSHLGDVSIGGTTDEVKMMTEFGFGIPTLAVGGDANSLKNDHPISFPYGPVKTEKDLEFRSTVDAVGNGVRFFGSDERVECSSCHDPHVRYIAPGGADDPAYTQYTPFLITSNAGSALCLACHIK